MSTPILLYRVDFHPTTLKPYVREFQGKETTKLYIVNGRHYHKSAKAFPYSATRYQAVLRYIGRLEQDLANLKRELEYKTHALEIAHEMTKEYQEEKA